MDVFRAAHALKKEQRMVIKIGEEYAIPSGIATNQTEEELHSVYRLFVTEPDFTDWQTYRTAKQKFHVISPAKHWSGLFFRNKKNYKKICQGFTSARVMKERRKSRASIP